VFQDRAARLGDKVFLRFGDQQLTYREANATANRYAAVLAARGVGRGDVVGIMLRNSPNAVLMMLAVVKCGAIAGMLNYHQRGEVLSHSLGLLDAKVLVAESDLVDAVDESGWSGVAPTTIEEMERLAATAPTTNPPSASAVLAKDTAFYIFTSGTTGHPKASVMTHKRWLAALAAFGGLGLRLKSSDTLYSCLPLYHNNALTVAIGSVINSGGTLALGKSFSASRFWDEVIASDATAFIYIGEICRYLLNQPAKPTDRAHKVRLIAGNGLRPEIWDEFTSRFGIARVCEFYAASEGNTAFINMFNVPKSAGCTPMPAAYVQYDTDTGAPLRGADGRVLRVPTGQPGLLLSPVTKLQPFDGYTDPSASEKKLVRNAFRDGDCWFNTGDLMSPQVMPPSSTDSATPSAGRAKTSPPRRWSGRWGPTSPSRTAPSSVWRFRVPAAVPEWRRSSCATAPTSTARRLPRPSTRNCRCTRCRCSCESSNRWNTPPRSRAAKWICVNRPTVPASRTRCTCWPAGTRAMCRSTTTTPTTSRPVSDRRAECLKACQSLPHHLPHQYRQVDATLFRNHCRMRYRRPGDIACGAKSKKASRPTERPK
jgi:hypothetical protein